MKLGRPCTKIDFINAMEISIKFRVFCCDCTAITFEYFKQNVQIQYGDVQFAFSFFTFSIFNSSSNAIYYNYRQAIANTFNSTHSLYPKHTNSKFIYIVLINKLSKCFTYMFENMFKNVY